MKKYLPSVPQVVQALIVVSLISIAVAFMPANIKSKLFPAQL